MTALLRITSSRINFLNPNAQFEILFKRTINNFRVKKNVEDFIKHRMPPNSLIDKEKIRNDLTESLKLESNDSILEKNSVNIRNNLLNFIFTSKSEQDIEFLVECLQKNSKKIKQSDKDVFLLGSNLMKLLYALKQTDKSMELFNDPATQTLFLNRETILILLSKLDEESRYSDIVFVYETYLNKIKEKEQRPILNDHIDIYSKALYVMDEKNISFKIKKLLEKFEFYNFELSNFSATYLFAILLKSNETKQLFDRLANYERVKIQNRLYNNFKIMNYAVSNEITNALNELESLAVDKKNKFFKLTLDILFDAVKKTNDSELTDRYNKIKSIVAKDSQLYNNTILEFVENVNNVYQNNLKKNPNMDLQVENITNSTDIINVPFKSKKSPDNDLASLLNENTSRSMEQFISPNTQSLFFNKDAILILMKKLEKETRYSDIVFVFETYLNKMNISNGYAILNDHIDLYSKALYFMNDENADPSIRVNNLLEKLGKFELSDFSAAYLFGLLFKTKKETKQLFEKLTKYKLKLSNRLYNNLKIINDVASNEILNALNELESMAVKKENKFFKSTLDALFDAAKKTNNSELVDRFNKIKLKIMKNSQLLNKYNMFDFVEYITNLKNNPKIDGPVQVKSDQKAITSSSKTSVENNELKQKTDLISISNKKLVNNQYELLSAQNKHNELVDLFETNLNNMNKIEPYHLKFYTYSLYKINTANSLMKTKEILAKIPIVIDDYSKLHVFFLALNQNDPYYAMSFISLTSLDRSSQTIYKNLKAIALAKINRIDDSINELKSIKDITKNVFTNDGFVFELTLDCLKQTEQNANRTKKINTLIESLRDQERISNLDLFDLMRTKSINKNNESEVQLATKILQKQSVTDNKPVIELQNPEEPTINLNKLYHECKFEEIVDSFESINNQSELTVDQLELVTKSILNSKISLKRLRSIVGSIAKKQQQLGFNSLVNLFLKYIQLNDPVGALNLLADLDYDEKFKNSNPTIYKNLLVIGFVSIGKIDLVIEQIEALFKIEMKTTLKNKYDGRLFPITAQHLKWCVENTKDENELKKLKDLMKRYHNEKRYCFIDLDAISSI